MANYKKLIDVEVMEEVSENTMALVEDNGTLKKVSCGAGFGGESPIKYTAIMVNLPQNQFWHCENMTFEEAYNHLSNGEIVDILFKGHFYDIFTYWSRPFYIGVGANNGVEYIQIVVFDSGEYCVYYWFDNGDLSESRPGSGDSV